MFGRRKHPLGHIHLVSFADSRLDVAARRFKRQAKRFGQFSTVKVYSEHSLDEDFMQNYRERVNPDVRGFGYWLWKPKIILDRLKELPEGNILFYADIGFHLNFRGKTRFEDWVDLLSSSLEPLLLFQAFPPSEPFSWDGRALPELADVYWCKRDLINFLGMDDDPALLQPTIGAGLIGIRNTPAALDFITLWFSIMAQNPNLVDDSPSLLPNCSSFREHRHDQAVLSLLAKKHETGVRLSTFEYWYPNSNRAGADWTLLRRAPFLAVRDHALKKGSAKGFATLLSTILQRAGWVGLSLGGWRRCKELFKR